MPPAVCNDSEDEEEVLVEDDHPSQRSRSSIVSYNAAIDFANEVLSASQGLDGANDRSSLSTGEISRQIADTTRGFFTSATDNSKTMPAPRSSAKEALSRRHTNLGSSADGVTSSKVLKRTMTTYGKSSAKSHRALKASSDEAFSAYRNDERTSQESLSADFLRESDTPKPTADGLPGGTILQDFQEHDPHALFPDTGSTVVNSESSMQRMLEMAREPLRQPLLHHNAEVSSHELQTQHSSPFAAWSASDKPTQTPKADSHKDSPLRTATVAGTNDVADAGPAHRAAGETVTDEPSNGQGTTAAAMHEQIEATPTSAIVKEPETRNTKIDVHAASEQAQHGAATGSELLHDTCKSKVPPRSSPMVIIPPTETPPVKQAKGTQKSSRGRKRDSVEADMDDTSQQRSEPLNSDDRAIGLPKELYKPRPSRRRATAVVEPVDYSAVPEKAMEKRRKTMDNDLSGVGTAAKGSQSSGNASSRSTQRGDLSKPVPSTRRNPGQDEEADLRAAIAASLRDVEQSTEAAIIIREGHDVSGAIPVARPADWKQPQRPVISPLSPPARPMEKAHSPPKPSPATQKSDSTSPVKMLPPTLPASAIRKTPRRSHTTIFEDHAAQRSPSLSQQQAARMAAVTDVTNLMQTSKRKRRTIVQNDDDDEEDELSKDAPPQKPTSRKRGRPSKAEAGAAKSIVIAPQDSEDEDLNLHDKSSAGPTSKRKSTQAAPPDSEAVGRESVVRPPAEDSLLSKISERVLQGSDADLELQDRVIARKPAQKKVPGRPRKSSAKVLDDSDGRILPEDDEDDDLNVQPKIKTKPDKNLQLASTVELAQHESHTKTALEPKDGNANTGVKPSEPASTETSGAPAIAKPVSKAAAKHTTPAPDVKPSPNSHSPIKKNAKVIHRVGLGRRQRVQPLLKMIRSDAKARKEDATRVTTVTSVAELERKWSEVPE